MIYILGLMCKVYRLYFWFKDICLKVTILLCSSKYKFIMTYQTYSMRAKLRDAI